MNNFLLVQTAFGYHQVAHVVDKKVDKLWESDQPRQTLQFLMKVLPEVQDVNLNGIIFVQGPGSFTSLRVGATWVNALAFTKNIPIYPLSTFTYLKLTNNDHAVLSYDTKHFFVQKDGEIKDEVSCPVGKEPFNPDQSKVPVNDLVAANLAGFSYEKQVSMTDVLYVVAPKITILNSRL